jgi:hypothetical protein
MDNQFLATSSVVVSLTCPQGLLSRSLVGAVLQILQTLLQEWAAEMALHHSPGSKKLIKHFRPPKLGIE